MKPRLKRICILLFFSGCVVTNCFSQKNNAAVKVQDIFDDLDFDDPASHSILRENETAAEKIKNNIFIRPVLSKKRCFVGEPVLLTYQLYTYLQSTSTVIKKPYLSGFFTSSMEISNERAKFKKEGGKSYRVFTILQWQLIPEKAGVLEIDEIKLDNKVQYKDETGKKGTYSGFISSELITMQVDPLPVRGQPKNFTGLTGKFTLSVFPSYNSIPAGKNNILQIEISGSGNFMVAQLPLITWPAGIDTFSATEKVEILRDSFPLSGRKIFEVPFVARKEGKLLIPAIHASYFDPVGRTYKTLSSEPVELNVLPFDGPVEALVKKPSAPVASKNKSLFYGLIIAAIFILAAIIFFIMWKKRKQKIERTAVLPVVADEETLKQLAEAEFKEELTRLNAIIEPLEFIKAFKILLTGYIQARMGTFLNQEEELVNKLQAKDTLLAEEVQDLYKQCNTLLYSPESLSPGNRLMMIKSLSDIHKKPEAIWA